MTPEQKAQAALNELTIINQGLQQRCINFAIQVTELQGQLDDLKNPAKPDLKAVPTTPQS
jgi:hypothetical protein